MLLHHHWGTSCWQPYLPTLALQTLEHPPLVISPLAEADPCCTSQMNQLLMQHLCSLNHQDIVQLRCPYVSHPSPYNRFLKHHRNIQGDNKTLGTQVESQGLLPCLLRWMIKSRQTRQAGSCECKHHPTATGIDSNHMTNVSQREGSSVYRLKIPSLAALYPLRA
jgi:hypothetical protein